MGYRCSLLAIRDKPLGELLHTLGFERTGERFEFAESGFTAIEARRGWNLLIASGMGLTDYFNEEDARQLSADGFALFFSCTTTSMITQLVGYQGGHAAWRVDYDGSGGATTPDIDGDPPDVIAQLAAERHGDQADGEGGDFMYEVTFDVIAHLTGVRPDESDLNDPQPFEELRDVKEAAPPPKPRGLFRRLFGQG